MGGVRRQNIRDDTPDNLLDSKSNSSSHKQKKSRRCMASIRFKLVIVTVIFLRLLSTPEWDSRLPSSSRAATKAFPSTNQTNQTTASPIPKSSTSQALPAKSSTAPTDPKPLSKAAKCVHKLITKARPRNLEKSTNPHRQQILYLHPGPPKTATTTIQQLLTNHRTQLYNDNIFFLGKTAPSERWNCDLPHPSHCIMYGQYSEQSDTNCTAKMIQQLDEYFRMGLDVVLSDEVIGAMFAIPENKKHHERARESLVALFEKMLRRNDWEIRLLIGYRPYFDFVKSQFSQLYTNRIIPSKNGSSRKFKGKMALFKWPGQQGGKHIPPLKNELFRKGWPTPDELVNLFKPHVDSIRVFDITQNHQRGDLSVRLFCDLLHTAHQTCSFRRAALDASQANHTEVRKNVAISLDYDRIATAAAAKGMVSTTRSRRSDVAAEIKKFVELSSIETNSTIRNFPLVCPTKEQTDKLYNLSMAQEMKLFPEREPHWETKVLFETMMEENKLCSVDTKKVLEIDEWKEFFQTFKK